jgi:cation diffusion facilitator CzcD-associated flavoprotein CzcO
MTDYDNAATLLDVLIVGAGFSGLAMAHALQRSGVAHYRIVEKAASVGGTWRENTYPGAACDVPSHLYSLSFAANARWSRFFVGQAEILAHLQTSWSDWIARGLVSFGWQLCDLRWDAEAHHWIARSSSGEQLRARFVVSALGGLHVPNLPDIPGREQFAGASWHSARWQHEQPIAGKRIGVIGTGTSAIQLIPELARLAGQLTVFQRTPVWVLPRPDLRIRRWMQSLLERAPMLRLSLRGALYLMLEALSLTLLRPRTAFWARASARFHLWRQVRDPALRSRLRPDYPLGCKRIALSNDFYPSLTRGNVMLESAKIAAIEPSGVRLADGRLIELDVLIHATGFRPMDVIADICITGSGDRKLSAAWAERPRSLLGLAANGFPNLFFLLGPNTALGHNSVLYMIETQALHISRLLERMRARGQTRVEATAAAEQAFIDRIDAAFPGTAWAGGCTSWYVDARGHNIALWVGPSWRYRLLARRPRDSDYEFA